MGNNHGGFREGAGRPKTGKREGLKVYLSPESVEWIKQKGMPLSEVVRILIEAQMQTEKSLKKLE